MRERIGWHAKITIHKFRDPDRVREAKLREGWSPEEVALVYGGLIGKEIHEGNVALNEGLQGIIDMICNLGSITPWDSAHARVGVGDSSEPADATQTGLLGANQAYVGMDSGYPTRDGQTAKWRGTFGTDQANFQWLEFTVDNGADEGRNLNRLVTDKGSKASGETWTLEVDITFS